MNVSKRQLQCLWARMIASQVLVVLERFLAFLYFEKVPVLYTVFSAQIISLICKVIVVYYSFACKKGSVLNHPLFSNTGIYRTV
jgi:hypothetical protein